MPTISPVCSTNNLADQTARLKNNEDNRSLNIKRNVMQLTRAVVKNPKKTTEIASRILSSSNLPSTSAEERATLDLFKVIQSIRSGEKNDIESMPIIRELLLQKANPNKKIPMKNKGKESFNLTSMEIAAQSSNLVVKELLKLVDVSTSEYNGDFSLLDGAYLAERPDIFETLVRKGAYKFNAENLIDESCSFNTQNNIYREIVFKHFKKLPLLNTFIKITLKQIEILYNHSLNSVNKNLSYEQEMQRLEKECKRDYGKIFDDFTWSNCKAIFFYYHTFKGNSSVISDEDLMFSQIMFGPHHPLKNCTKKVPDAVDFLVVSIFFGTVYSGFYTKFTI